MELNLTRPIVFFDLETTGVNVGTDRIVEIGLLKISQKGKEESRNYLVNPTIPIPVKATAIHGIKDDDVKDCPVFKDITPQLIQFIDNADLGGYNAIKFDIPLLVEELLRADIDFDVRNRRIVDVQNIFHKMEPRTLSAAYRFYCGKELTNAHSASADTNATYEILKKQLDFYKETPVTNKNGEVTYPVVNDVEALHKFSFYNKFADLVGHIIFDEHNCEVFNFGKYKGRSVEATFKAEPSYYDWMMKADFPLSTKKVISAIRLRGFNNQSVNVVD